MRKVLKRLVAAFFVILMLVSLFPFQVFAVDPVSAATMANALAQAITAYGASQGVSLTFDVSSSDGIGEGVHELWNNFKQDIQDNNVPTYDSLAITMWADIYKKVGNNIGININDTEMPYIDAFWNWLLSGPAEMTKVDNQYYEWTVDQNNSVTPITILNITEESINGYQVYRLPLSCTFNGTPRTFNSNDSDLRYVMTYVTNPFVDVYIYFFTPNSGSSYYYNAGNDIITNNIRNTDSHSNCYSAYTFVRGDSSLIPYCVTSGVYTYPYQVIGDFTYSNIQSEQSNLDVKPYIGDPIPQDIYIPDNEDVNYSPLPYVGGIDRPWDNTLFGDGTGSLTDAQKEAISGALDNAIEDDGTLTLEEDQTVPDNPGAEVIGGPSAYTVPGLADVFPFCIPFDIYHFLQALAADPTPPHFTATLAFPEAVGGSQQIEIDFDTPTFNQIAAILRTMELLAFCIGLALLTRSMFIRG